MAWIFAIVALLASAFVLLVVAYLAGQIVAPLYEVVVNDPTVQKVGYDAGAEVAARIGLKYVLPFMALALVFWFLFLRLRRDSYLGRVNGRR